MDAFCFRWTTSKVGAYTRLKGPFEGSLHGGNSVEVVL